MSPEDISWWVIRPAQNLSASVYRCPLCDNPLPALSPHVLVIPEGDPSRRRHAHSECVDGARRRGELPLREELAPPPPSRRWWVLGREKGE